LVILQDGTYVAAHDFFGPGKGVGQTEVYQSRDQGATWSRTSVVDPLCWASLFEHRGDLYLMGTTGDMADLVIHRSRDGGKTWTTPRDAQNGLLLSDGKYHCAPVPLVVADGRIWRAAEEFMGRDKRRRVFRAFLMSAPLDADLLSASSWTCTNRLDADFSWLGGGFGSWLEGNVVCQPDGTLANILRTNTRPGFKVDKRFGEEKVAIATLDRGGQVLSFDPVLGFVDFPGGGKKFTIRFDPKTLLYWTLANQVLPGSGTDNPERVRNTLALVSSPDLRHWTTRSIVLHHPDTEYHAFQYVDWRFDGDDIVFVSRTAFDDGEGGAKRQHDANYLTFHRVRDYGKLRSSSVR
jgi:hypothetical protein